MIISSCNFLPQIIFFIIYCYFALTISYPQVYPQKTRQTIAIAVHVQYDLPSKEGENMGILIDLRKENVFSASGMEAPKRVMVENRSAHRFYNRLDDLGSPEAHDGGIIFEADPGSPYFMALDGQNYHPDSRFGPVGTCPVCNNSQHGELDHALAKMVGRVPLEGAFGFPKHVLVEHIACHMGPVYAKAGIKACALAGLAVGKKQHTVYSGNNIGEAVLRTAAAERYDGDPYLKVDVLSEADLAWYDSAYERAENRPPPSPHKEWRPKGAAPGTWYAYDGNKQVGALRPWGDDRVSKELAKREDEAIVFYDEMLDARRMARRIYSDIMESDIDALNAEKADEKGGKYVERNYSAAIAAVREIRSIATDMAKLALIATKYSDGKEARRVLSPVMQGMIDEIGVFDTSDTPDSFGDADDAEYEPVGAII